MKKGIVSLLLLGIVAVLLLLGLTVFGPWELPGLGQLSQRQQGQEASAAEIAFPGPDDADKDGFKDSVEKWIGTDVNDNCADDANDAAWPPDFNNDKKVDQTDAEAFRPYILSSEGQRKYNRRFDLNADKKVNVGDTVLIRPYFGVSCPFNFVKATPKIESVIFNWTPGFQNEYPNIQGIDMTQKGTTECSEQTMQFPRGIFVSSIGPGQTSAGSQYAVAGHKYCVALYSGGYGQFRHSQFITYTVGSYDLKATPAIESVSFSWTPGLEQGGGSIQGIDMTQKGTTECSEQTMQFPRGVFVTDLAKGTTSATTQYAATGHNYCIALYHEGTRTSQFVTYTVTVPTSPSPPSVTECSDQIDNDGDGLVDIADSNCVSSSDDSEAT